MSMFCGPHGAIVKQSVKFCWQGVRPACKFTTLTSTRLCGPLGLAKFPKHSGPFEPRTINFDGLQHLLSCCGGLAFLAWTFAQGTKDRNGWVACETLPVMNVRPALVVDTDIGDAIDDLWALACVVNDPRVDLKLVSVCAGDQHQLDARACIVAKFLSTVGRTDVSVGMGLPRDRVAGSHIGSYFSWASQLDLVGYQRKTSNGYETACQLVALAKQHDELIVLAIGSPTNLAEAVKLGGHDFAKRVHVVGMYSFGDEGTELGGWNSTMDEGAFDVLLGAPFASFTTLSAKAAYRPWFGGYPWKPNDYFEDREFASKQYSKLRSTAKQAAAIALFECEDLYDKQEMKNDPEGRLRRRPASHNPSPSWDAVVAFLMLSELSGQGGARILSSPAPGSRKSAAARLSFCHDWADEQQTCRRFWDWCHQCLL